MKRFILLALLFAVGCGSAPKLGNEGMGSSQRKPAPGGGYYLDDGPGARQAADLNDIPDARPKIEPLHRYANRPYVALGKMYTPQMQAGGYKVRGIASWYGKRFHGRKTASGEIYDMYAMSAAHTTLPIPSYVRVSNVKNGKSVVVRVNDRGPFHADRIIDLSYTAASKLDLIGAGSGEVEVESLLPGAAQPAPRETVAALAQPAPQQEPAAMPVSSDSGGVYLQLGAFSARDNADNFLSRLKNELAEIGGTPGILVEDDLFRVRIGPFADPVAARGAADKIQHSLNIKPVLIAR